MEMFLHVPELGVIMTIVNYLIYISRYFVYVKDVLYSSQESTKRIQS